MWVHHSCWLANLIGTAMDTTLSALSRQGLWVPNSVRRDRRRLQLLHEQDAAGRVERAAWAGKSRPATSTCADGIMHAVQGRSGGGPNEFSDARTWGVGVGGCGWIR